jgi:pimeloyl-ACP methyl ester carboxylesterase
MTGGRILVGLVGFVLGLAALILLAVIEFGAWVLIAPPRSRTEEEAGEVSHDHVYIEGTNPAETISALARDGARLAGLWYSSAAEKSTGRTVLLLHGFAEASGALQALRVAALNRSGWNAAALDLRGYGNSDGQFASFGGREATDISVWLDALANRLGPTQPLVPVVWGRSMGAAIALKAAAADHRVKAVVLESPMVDLDHALGVWFRKRRFPAPRLLARLITRRASQLAGVSLTRPRLIELAPRLECPALIIHGSNDMLVPDLEVRRLAEAFPVPPRFIEVSGAGHADVVAVGGDELLAEITRFVSDAAREESW